MGGHTLQKAATLLPRNVPRTVRVRPTKQGNGNPTKGALSLSPFHHGTMLSVRRTSALLRFSDSTRDFFPPLAPISSIRFNPSLPFSPLSSPHHLSILPTIAAQLRGPLESSKTPAKPLADICSREVLRFIESRTLGSSMITREKRENIFQRYFREILFHRAIRRSVQSVILISSDIFYRQSHRSMSCANKRMSNRRV